MDDYTPLTPPPRDFESPLPPAEKALLFIEVERQDDKGQWWYLDGAKTQIGPFKTQEAAVADRAMGSGWYYSDTMGLHGPYTLDEAREKSIAFHYPEES